MSGLEQRLAVGEEMEPQSETRLKPARKAIFGCLSWVALVSGLGGCRYCMSYFPGPGGEDSLGYALSYLMMGWLGCVLSSIFAIVGLRRGERPRSPAIGALVVALPLALAGVFAFILLRA
jgi:hypothetical protein